MGLVTVGESTIHYREYGDTAHPPLVIIHGLFSDSSALVPLAEQFASRFRVIVPDMLGHGQSARLATFTLEDQGRTVNGLLDSLAISHAALVGISMGSYIAAQAAILEPERTSRLVLVVGKSHGMTSSTEAYAKRIGFDLSTATPEERTAALAGALWSPHTSQERRDAFLASSTTKIELDAAEQAVVQRSLAGFDLRPQLPSITASTLVISGEADGLNPPSDGEALAQLIPGAQFRVYERSGHMLHFEEQDRFVAEVTDWVLDLSHAAVRP